MNSTPKRPLSAEELANAKRLRELVFIGLLRAQMPFILKRTDRPVLTAATWDGEPAYICLNLDAEFGAVFSKSGKFLGMAYA